MCPQVQVAPLARPLLTRSLLLFLCACAPLDEEAAPESALQQAAAAEPTSEASLRLETASEATLKQGKATPVAENIAAAENLHMTSDERLIVSGDDGLYEVRKLDQSYLTTQVAAAPDCQFAGIAECRGHIYANCYNFTNSYLYASELGEPLRFRRIHTLTGVPLANGLASDGQGNLYVGSTFLGQILKLRVSSEDGFAISERTVYLNATGLFTNGVDVFQSALHWSDGGNVNRVPIGSEGRPGRRGVVARRLFTVFDDLFVDSENLLVADYLDNAVRAFDHEGNLRATSAMPLTTPSAVLATHGRAGFPEGSLLVTEKSAHRVTLIAPSSTPQR